MITQHTQFNITCWKIHNTLLSIYPNPLIKSAPCLPFRWIYYVIKKNANWRYRSTWGARLLSSTLTFLEGCDGYNYDPSFSCSVWCHCWHLKKDEDNCNFLFLLGARISDWTSNYSALYFLGFIHAHAITFLK